jgi:predicted transcriptional regulator YdeE/DNA-binding transcriptional MerR regulator
VLKIGDFSRLGGVTVKALRHYAQLGLLRPASVDRFSGYRYYSIHQLARLNRILALKELGFSLDQVAILMRDDLPVERLRGILEEKQAELAERVHLEGTRLSRVVNRLAQIEMEGKLPLVEVILKHSPSLAVAMLCEHVERVEDLSVTSLRLRERLRSLLERGGVGIAGPWIRLNESSEYEDEDIDLQMAVAVDGIPVGRSAARVPSEVSFRVLPEASQLASVLYTPGVGDLPQAYRVLLTWMEQCGYQPNGAYREVFVEDMDVADASNPVIEVQAPVLSKQDQFQLQNVYTRQKETQMDVKFVELPALMVQGFRFYGKFQEGEIPKVWDTFNHRAGEIKNAVWKCTYGVCIMPEGGEEGVFEYVAACEVKGVEVLPEGMVVRIVPSQKYAVFEHHGKLDKLQATYEYIHQVWLQQSGYHHSGGPELEVYDEKFKDNSDESVFYIYIPVTA